MRDLIFDIDSSIKAMTSVLLETNHWVVRPVLCQGSVKPMMEIEKSTILIASNTSTDIKSRLNESSIIYSVINSLILSIAEDIGVETHFDYYSNNSPSADIAINFNEESTINFTSIWPFYQDCYSFVYSNSKKLTFYRSFITTMTLKDYLILAAPIAMTMTYHFLVMRFRLKKTIFDSFWNAYLYSLQTFTNGPTPNLNKYPHDKFFLAGLYIFIFVAMFTFLTIFSSHCTVPHFLPAFDQELLGIRQIEYTKSFGIGESCLKEILSGTFERRSCMIPCLRAISVANVTQQIRITSEINFRNVLKVSRKSKYFHKIYRLLSGYNENGIFEHIFKVMHQSSYSNLTSSTFNPVLTVEEIRVFILNGYVLGIWASWLSFAIEMVILISIKYLKRRRNQL